MFKRCTRCGAEYQLTVSQCADCGGELEHFDPAPSRVPAPGPSDLPPSHQLTCLRVDNPMWLDDLAEALQRAGITSRIDSDPPGQPIRGPAVHSQYGHSGWTTRVGLYVRESDLEAAQGIDREVFASRTPDATSEPAASDDGVCPACGVALAPAAAECSSCGLVFPES